MQIFLFFHIFCKFLMTDLLLTTIHVSAVMLPLGGSSTQCILFAFLAERQVDETKVHAFLYLKANTALFYIPIIISDEESFIEIHNKRRFEIVLMPGCKFKGPPCTDISS